MADTRAQSRNSPGEIEAMLRILTKVVPRENEDSRRRNERIELDGGDQVSRPYAFPGTAQLPRPLHLI